MLLLVLYYVLDDCSIPSCYRGFRRNIFLMAEIIEIESESFEGSRVEETSTPSKEAKISIGTIIFMSLIKILIRKLKCYYD